MRILDRAMAAADRARIAEVHAAADPPTTIPLAPEDPVVPANLAMVLAVSAILAVAKVHPAASTARSRRRIDHRPIYIYSPAFTPENLRASTEVHSENGICR